MKKMFFKTMVLSAFGLMIMSCDADDDLTQPDADQSATASFKFARPGQMVLAGTNVDLINESKNATSYQWDLGDGTNSTDATPQHAYDKAGTYTVTLTVTDADGNLSSFTDEVNVFGTTMADRASAAVFSRN